MNGKKAYGPYEAIMLGVQLEDAGQAFYSAVASLAGDYRVKNLFNELAKAEAQHRRVIKEEIEPRFTPEWYREEDQQMLADYLEDVEPQPVFPSPTQAASFARTAKDLRRAVDAAIRAEERSRDYYAVLRDATMYRQGKEAFEKLYFEEIKHLELLLKLKKDL